MPRRGYRAGPRALCRARHSRPISPPICPICPSGSAWSHLVIARAGASTIAELTAAGRPAILVPLPRATDDHQTANAREMARAGGARMIAAGAASPPVELAKQMQKLGARARGARQCRRARQRGRPARRGARPRRPGRADRPRSRRRSAVRARERAPADAGRGAGMRGVGTDIGTIHFVGIGGIGMSGIAEVMHILGYKVQGSDVAEGYVVEGLRERGIPVAIGHSADNLGDAAVVVDLDRDQEGQSRGRQAAYERRIPVVRRAEMLAELMRLKSTVAVAGTHGKTTTTSMIAALLDAGGIDPTVINGGIINAYGSNARLGSSRLDGGRGRRERRQLPAARRHDRGRHQHRSRASRPLWRRSSGEGRLRRVRRERALLRRRLALRRSSRGAVDHPAPARPAHRHLRLRRPGRRARRECHAGAGRQPLRRVAARPRTARSATIAGIELPMPGRHNVQNALAAIGVAAELGIADEIDRARLRRASTASSAASPRSARSTASTIIDDYGHHPVEIKAVLSAAREGADGPGDRGRPAAPLHPAARPDGRVPGRLQRRRHRARRAGLCGRRGADRGRRPRGPGRGAEGARPSRRRRPWPTPTRSAAQLRDLAAPGDMVICLGAGDITKWAAGLADGIRKARAAPMSAVDDPPAGARPADRRRAAGASRLVQVGRPGRVAVRAEGRRRSAATSSPSSIRRCR